MRISFERGFIDYIKHGNEQRLQLLSDALGKRVLRSMATGASCATMIALSFQILRSFEHDNSEVNPAGMPHRRHVPVW